MGQNPPYSDLCNPYNPWSILRTLSVALMFLPLVLITTHLHAQDATEAGRFHVEHPRF